MMKENQALMLKRVVIIVYSLPALYIYYSAIEFAISTSVRDAIILFCVELIIFLGLPVLMPISAYKAYKGHKGGMLWMQRLSLLAITLVIPCFVLFQTIMGLGCMDALPQTESCSKSVMNSHGIQNMLVSIGLYLLYCFTYFTSRIVRYDHT